MDFRRKLNANKPQRFSKKQGCFDELSHYKKSLKRRQDITSAPLLKSTSPSSINTSLKCKLLKPTQRINSANITNVICSKYAYRPKLVPYSLALNVVLFKCR